MSPGTLVGCVSVVVYGLPEGYEPALARLRERLASGRVKRHWASLKALDSAALGGGPVAELRSLVVSELRRGLGLGGDLIEAAKAEAKRRGFAELYTLVNEKAIGLFERSGFRRAEGTPQKLVVDCATCVILERCNELPIVA
ncbi:MAG: Argininosuccinate synthase (modular protein), partial [Dehalococcoidia bacterium]|nr:Argininosuccinate synthase (modular protein) [Dehalococcoidia bacterium]